MHRLILSSNTYRQASQASDASLDADRSNRLLSRFPRQRLEGEVIRDSVLAASGRLNLEMGGPAVFPPLPEGLDREQRVQSINTWETSPEPDSLRRSLYVYQRRSLTIPILEAFDAPVLNASCERRRTTVTALQPLAMYDSEFVNGESRWFAERLRKQTGADPGAWIGLAFRIAFGREPSEAERQRSLGFLQAAAKPEDGLVGLCRVLLNGNEFLYVD